MLCCTALSSSFWTHTPHKNNTHQIYVFLTNTFVPHYRIFVFSTQTCGCLSLPYFSRHSSINSVVSLYCTVEHQSGSGCNTGTMLICLFGSGYNTGTKLICLFGSGYNTGTMLICLLGSGYNTETMLICLFGSGCNTGTMLICLFGSGCNARTMLICMFFTKICLGISSPNQFQFPWLGLILFLTSGMSFISGSTAHWLVFCCMVYCATLHTVLYCIVFLLCYVVLYWIVLLLLYCIVAYCTDLSCTVPYCTACHITLYRIILYGTVHYINIQSSIKKRKEKKQAFLFAFGLIWLTNIFANQCQRQLLIFKETIFQSMSDLLVQSESDLLM